MSEPYAGGYLHRPSERSNCSLVLTHGAGSNCNAPLLVAVGEDLARRGWTVYRFDLPFRRKRAHGPPFPSGAKDDREGIRQAVSRVGDDFPGRMFLGGHSYGGRQASMAAAEDSQLAAGLLLLSYPLHPPDKPAQLRTAHFPNLRTKTAFVHGSRDPFGSPDELRTALALIPAPTSLHMIEGAGHELGRPPRRAVEVVAELAQGFLRED